MKLKKYIKKKKYLKGASSYTQSSDSNIKLRKICYKNTVREANIDFLLTPASQYYIIYTTIYSYQACRQQNFGEVIDIYNRNSKGTF